jgi:hypothetical protein
MQVKGLFNADGLGGRGGGGGRDGPAHNSSNSSSNNTWSSPTHINENNQKKEAAEPSRRDSSSPIPTGRIAVPPPAESPLSAHHSLPLFPPQSGGVYPRPPFPPLPPALYQTFTGFQRPDSANSKPTATPTPSSVMSFSSKSELPSPSHTPSGGGRDSTSSQYKFSPRRGGVDRENDPYESGGNGKQELGRSPALRRSSSDAFGGGGDRCGSPPLRGAAKQLMSSDSTTTDPSQSPSRRFAGESADRLRLKTEMPGSPVERKRTFSGDFSRESLGRLSSTRSEAAEGNCPLLIFLCFVVGCTGTNSIAWH